MLRPHEFKVSFFYFQKEMHLNKTVICDNCKRFPLLFFEDIISLRENVCPCMRGSMSRIVGGTICLQRGRQRGSRRFPTERGVPTWGRSFSLFFNRGNLDYISDCYMEFVYSLPAAPHHQYFCSF